MTDLIRTWKSFETYYKRKIVWVVASTDPNVKEPIVVLHEFCEKSFAKDKNKDDLREALGNFLTSLSDKVRPTASGTAHDLPEITKKVNDNKIVLKTWDELFPNRNTQRFGLRSNNKEIDANTWAVMKEIYDLWQFAIENAETLSSLSDELEDLYNKTVNEEEAMALRRREPQIQEKLRIWIEEYNKAIEKVRKDRQGEYKQNLRIYNALKTLPETDYTTITPQKGFFDNMSDWGVGKIALVFGSGLILLFLAGWVIKKLYNIN